LIVEKIQSKDGVSLALQRYGDGTPLVLVHGTGGSAARWSPVVPALEARFAIYALDRRGRGQSGDAPEYEIQREFEDIECVVDAIGPAHVLGHSYGGVCSLEAALLTPHLRKLILYEPAIPVEGMPIYPAGFIARLESLLAAGEREKAAITFMQEVVRMPVRELENLRASHSWPGRVAAAHTLPRELRAHERYRFKPERFERLKIPTLLLLGSDSPDFFKAAIEVVNAALSNSRIVVLPGQRHNAIDVAPELFVREVLAFLTDEDAEL
jgi:pimeloyl-ACP methyl ester carboxylesterase